ncbi:unnamed protein product [Caenorhabditis brenneri]
MSNVGNIVLEQDPRQQDPFYRNFYARAEGMPLAAVNSVVHNVKHQSEGQFKLWHELPSHKVRPGYSTTTKAPKIKTTTVPWVRGRHRPQLGLQQVPWQQNDPDGYDTGQHGSDYDEGLPAPRTRGRRPTGGRGRRPPPPMAPVRVQIGKEDGLVENGDGEGLDLATLDEGTRAGDSEGTKDTEGAKVTTTEKTTTTKAASKVTKKPEKKKEKDKKKEENADDEDSEGSRKKDENEEEENEGEKHGEIDLADLKNGGVIHEPLDYNVEIDKTLTGIENSVRNQSDAEFASYFSESFDAFDWYRKFMGKLTLEQALTYSLSRFGDVKDGKFVQFTETVRLNETNTRRTPFDALFIEAQLDNGIKVVIDSLTVHDGRPIDEEHL